MKDRHPLRLAVGQLPLHGGPADVDALRRSGRLIRDLMHGAHREGARLLHLPEGATCSPHKLAVSSLGPTEVGPADWSRVVWETLRAELERIAALAGELQLWTVLGSVHRLSPPHRPHNSLFVVSADGNVHTRYDERYLSHTKTTFMYSPGRQSITFEVDGWQFGCALGIESHFPEVFSDYEQRDVDCVLFSSTGDGDGDASTFAVECQGHAAVNGYWVSFSVPPQQHPAATAGVVAPGGRWLRRCPATADPAIVTLELGEDSEDITTAVTKARPWRRVARGGVYRAHVVDDVRSDERAGF